MSDLLPSASTPTKTGGEGKNRLRRKGEEGERLTPAPVVVLRKKKGCLGLEGGEREEKKSRSSFFARLST